MKGLITLLFVACYISVVLSTSLKSYTTTKRPRTTRPTTAPPKKPCCLPEQFESHRGKKVRASMGGRSHDAEEEEDADRHHHHPRPHPRPHSRTVEVGSMAYISADFTNHQFAAHEVVFKDRRRFNVTVLSFPAKKTMYIIAGGRCKKIPLKNAVENRCLPAKAKFGGTVHIGVGSHVFDVDNWFMMAKSRTSIMGFRLSVTPAECMLVSDGAAGKSRSKRWSSHEFYFDGHLGIKDPKIFAIPSICSKFDYDSDAIIEELIPEISIFDSYLFNDMEVADEDYVDDYDYGDYIDDEMEFGAQFNKL